MKILNGQELVDYIKVRQLHQVRSLKQSHKIIPKMAIILTVDNPVINTYVRLKQKYGEDIGVETQVFNIKQSDITQKILELNQNDKIHGIIVQLPLENPDETDKILPLIDPKKDIDGLTSNSSFDPATPVAINWLLTGYNIELFGKKIVLVGHGKLVGAPLEKMWLACNYNVTSLDDTVVDLKEALKDAEIIITATGVAGLIKSEMLPIGCTVVDAGTASEHGKIVGDLAQDARERHDLTITPVRGGVGPLTIAALFDNILRACLMTPGT